MKLEGVLPPVTTPFTDGEVDLGALRRNVQRWMQTRLTGVVVLGSNGEAPYVDDDEADRIVEAARSEMPAGRVLIAGTGRESTRATIAASQRAARAGAHAVLVRTPSFFKGQMTPEAFVRHYEAVADAAAVPVFLYNFTALTGVSLTSATVGRLALHPNVVGIKESGSDVAQVADLVACARDGFAVMAGSAATFYASLCVGASGGILAAACVVPDLCADLYDAVRRQHHDRALALQRRLTPLARLVTSVHGVPGLKAALDLTGYYGGDPRPPLLRVPATVVDQIREQLHMLQQIPA